MADPHNSDRDRSASSRPSAGSTGRETVLLSDLPDSGADSGGPNATVVSNPALSHINISPDTLAALSTRYEILAEAGSGSMGNVYKARDRETGGIVALKLLKPEIATDKQMMDRFKRELLFARKITHKNVCRVYDFNRVNGVAYTSMEFVEGESLRALLNRAGQLPADRATQIALRMCSGLKEAHAQGIVHRDLKPENVMVDSAGNVKIMDFGIARSMDAATRLTGSLAGTPAYMAPEQVSGKPVDYRTDIYSLGLVFYEMFTGAPAFKAENSVAVALKQMSEEVVAPHFIEPRIPVSIERIILKCLEKEPERRFLSVAELESALAAPHTARTIASSAGQPAFAASAPGQQAAPSVARVPPRGVLPPPTASSKALPVLWVLLGVGLALVVLGGLRAAAIQKAANQIVFNEKIKAPVPPAFAYEIPKPAPVPATDSPEATSANSPVASAASDAKAEPVAKDAKSVSATPKSTPPPAPTVAVNKPVPTPEVFPRMESSPLRRRMQPGIAPVFSVPTEMILAGHYTSQSKARDKQKIVGMMLFPSKIILHHSSKGDTWVLYVGPIKVSRGPLDVETLEAKGFSGAKEVSMADYQKAQK
jgi:serine/threonine protein kinase